MEQIEDPLGLEADVDRYQALYSDPEYYEMDRRVGFGEMRRNTAWMLRPLSFSPR